MGKNVYASVKSYSQRGKLLNRSDFQTLAESRDLEELMTRIKNTIYGDAVSDVQKPYSSQGIESGLRGHLADVHYSIAKKQKIAWKNIYSGIFRDLDEILLPMEIAEEDGRLPLKRGPKALQEKGIPYYHLTKKGILVGLAINGIENMSLQLKEFFSKSDSEDKEFEKILMKFMTNSPNFTYSIFQKYVKAFCEDKIEELLPFDLTKLKNISDESLIIQKEILTAFLKFTNPEKKEATAFLDKIG